MGAGGTDAGAETVGLGPAEAPGVGRGTVAKLARGGDAIGVDIGVGRCTGVDGAAKLAPGGEEELAGPATLMGGTEGRVDRVGAMHGAGCISAPRAAFMASVVDASPP